MDEVGFMIKEIKADGTFRRRTWWLNPLVVATTLTLAKPPGDGRVYPVISGSVPPIFLRASGGASGPSV